MNGHHALGIVGYQRQGILDAEKALAAAVGYLVVLGEVMYLTEMLPIILLILWQYEDDFEWRVESFMNIASTCC